MHLKSRARVCRQPCKMLSLFAPRSRRPSLSDLPEMILGSLGRAEMCRLQHSTIPYELLYEPSKLYTLLEAKFTQSYISLLLKLCAPGCRPRPGRSRAGTGLQNILVGMRRRSTSSLVRWLRSRTRSHRIWRRQGAFCRLLELNCHGGFAVFAGAAVPRAARLQPDCSPTAPIREGERSIVCGTPPVGSCLLQNPKSGARNRSSSRLGFLLA